MKKFSTITAFGGVSFDTVVSVPAFLNADQKEWAEVIGRFPGGMGANVAAAFAALGGEAALVSAVGRDAAGAASLDTLRRLNVDISQVAQREGSTFETLAMIDGSGEKAMLLLKAPDLVLGSDGVFKELTPGKDAMHVMPGRYAPPLERLTHWHERGVHTSFDIEPSMLRGGLDYQSYLACADVLFCGDVASRMMSDRVLVEQRISDLLELGPDLVVVTLGRHGAIAGDRSGQFYVSHGHHVAAVNTTGAGDVFAGTSLFGISQGWPTDVWLVAANLAAAHCVQSHASQSLTFGIADIHAAPELASFFSSCERNQ